MKPFVIQQRTEHDIVIKSWERISGDDARAVMLVHALDWVHRRINENVVVKAEFRKWAVDIVATAPNGVTEITNFLVTQ